MADFSISYEITARLEGRYGNNPCDRGGETYRGIARNRWPEWKGWELIDQAKSEPGFPANLEGIAGLQELVKGFYLTIFWSPLKADGIKSQTVANELYDTAVNCGRSTAIKFLQESLNALNNQGSRWPDVNEDGGMGAATLAAVNVCTDCGLEDVLLILMNGRQIDHYYRIMLRDASQEVFAVGWLRARCRTRC